MTIESPHQQSHPFEILRQECQALVDTEQEIEDLEAQLEIAKKRRLYLKRERIPVLMAELQVPSITIGNRPVSIEPFIVAQMPKEESKRQECVNWLMKHGLKGILKRRLEIELPKDDMILEAQILEQLEPLHLPTHIDFECHHKTYTAQMKKLVLAGEDVPECMGVFTAMEAVVG